jgi:hypothetical protein
MLPGRRRNKARGALFHSATSAALRNHLRVGTVIRAGFELQVPKPKAVYLFAYERVRRAV